MSSWNQKPYDSKLLSQKGPCDNVELLAHYRKLIYGTLHLNGADYETKKVLMQIFDLYVTKDTIREYINYSAEDLCRMMLTETMVPKNIGN
jgi:hypothetical protein